MTVGDTGLGRLISQRRLTVVDAIGLGDDTGRAM